MKHFTCSFWINPSLLESRQLPVSNKCSDGRKLRTEPINNAAKWLTGRRKTSESPGCRLNSRNGKTSTLNSRSTRLLVRRFELSATIFIHFSKKQHFSSLPLSWRLSTLKCDLDLNLDVYFSVRKLRRGARVPEANQMRESHSHCVRTGSFGC